MVDKVLYVTGGFDGYDFTSILSWNPSTETWQTVGELSVGRAYHAAVAAPSAILSTKCSEI